MRLGYMFEKFTFLQKWQLFILVPLFPQYMTKYKSKPTWTLFHSILVLETRIIKTLEASSVSLLLLKLYKEFSIVGSEEKLNKLKF